MLHVKLERISLPRGRISSSVCLCLHPGTCTTAISEARIHKYLAFPTILVIVICHWFSEPQRKYDNFFFSIVIVKIAVYTLAVHGNTDNSLSPRRCIYLRAVKCISYRTVLIDSITLLAG